MIEITEIDNGFISQGRRAARDGEQQQVQGKPRLPRPSWIEASYYLTMQYDRAYLMSDYFSNVTG